MQLVLGAAGAAIGAPFGMAGLGWSIGSTLGALLQGSEKQVNAQPIMDLRVPGTQDGRPLPWIRGRLRVGPDWAWHTDRRPTTTSTTTGGKGIGGGPEVETQETTYDMDALFVLNVNGGVGVSEIYRSGELIWRTDAGASSGTIAASNSAEHWDRLTVYTGAPDQLPDPDYEAWVDANVGVGQAPAYRGRLTVFVKGLKLGTGGQVPQLEFTVVADGTTGSKLTYFTGGITSTSQHTTVAFAPAQQALWVDDPQYSTSNDDPDRLGVFDLGALTWSYVELQSPWHKLGEQTDGPRLLLVPEYDVIYVSARDPDTLFHNVLVYRLSSREYVGSFKDMIGGDEADAHAIIGADPDHQTILVHSFATGLAIWQVDAEGRPALNLGIFAAPQPGHDVRATPDRNGNYWLRYGGAEQFWKISTSGRTVIAPDSDGAFSGVPAYDSSRHCMYYWSDIGSGGEYLKKIDCDTHAMSRVNSVAYATGGAFPSHGQLFYADDLDRVISLKTINGPTADAYVLTPDSGSIESSHDTTDGAFHITAAANHSDYASGILWFAASTGAGELRLNALTPACPTVADVQEAIFVRGGLEEAQINVAPLSAITRNVCSFPWSQISPSREPTERMMGCYFYETVHSGSKIKCVPRGGSAVATIPYEDLGAHISGEGGTEEPLPLRLSNDVEMPAHTLVKFINLSNNYQDGAEKSDRLITATAVTVTPIDLAIGLVPEEGKGVADTIQRDMASALLRGRIQLLRSDYPGLEPTDVILVTGRDGSQYRVRVVQIVDRFPVLECDIVLDDPNVLSNQGITSSDYESQTTVSAPARTILRLIDPPILRDEDNSPGLYVLTKPDRTPSPGSAVFSSPNDVDYERIATIPESAVFGSTTTALGDWTGPRTFDMKNSVTVSIGDGTLASSTRALVLGSKAINAIKIGSEIIQFVTATLISPGVYRLTKLLRGCRGTEWAMTGHAAGEPCELLRTAGMRRVSLSTANIGVSRYYKGVTLGRSLASATAQQFVASSGGMKPFSPARVLVSRDGSNNATIAVTRRTRLATRFTGPLGISVPLGEQTEAYSIDVYSDGTFTTVVDTLSVIGTNVVTYTAAAQTAAGLTPGNDLHMRAYQISAIVGRGYALQKAA